MHNYTKLVRYALATLLFAASIFGLTWSISEFYVSKEDFYYEYGRDITWAEFMNRWIIGIISLAAIGTGAYLWTLNRWALSATVFLVALLVGCRASVVFRHRVDEMLLVVSLPLIILYTIYEYRRRK